MLIYMYVVWLLLSYKSLVVVTDHMSRKKLKAKT